jgi:hypothetical protein
MKMECSCLHVSAQLPTACRLLLLLLLLLLRTCAGVTCGS